MSRLTDHELEDLLKVADEIRSSLEAEGYTVDSALDMNDAFRDTKICASDLERAIVLKAARRSASQTGLGSRDESNSLDITSSTDFIERYFRVKRVKITADGEIAAICNRGSSLLVNETDMLMTQEKWIFGFTISEDRLIDRMFVAEVRDWHDSGHGPVRLVLGPIVDLMRSTPPRGFTSTDEGLEGFDDEEGVADAG